MELVLVPITSDHYMVVAKLRLRLKSCFKRVKKLPTLDTSSLKDPVLAEQFQLKLKNRFEALELLDDIEDEWAIISSKYKKKPWISAKI